MSTTIKCCDIVFDLDMTSEPSEKLYLGSLFEVMYENANFLIFKTVRLKEEDLAKVGGLGRMIVGNPLSLFVQNISQLIKQENHISYIDNFINMHSGMTSFQVSNIRIIEDAETEYPDPLDLIDLSPGCSVGIIFPQIPEGFVP